MLKKIGDEVKRKQNTIPGIEKRGDSWFAHYYDMTENVVEYVLEPKKKPFRGKERMTNQFGAVSG